MPRQKNTRISRDAGSELLETVRQELVRAADTARAPAMQAYMKSSMPYHGVGADTMRAVCKRVFAPLQFESAGQWSDAVRSLWRGARFREERYAAVELSALKKALPFQTMRALPLYEEMIVTGAWWDYVDFLAKDRLGLLLRREPAPMRRAMLAWSRSDDMWKRRSAILCQLAFKTQTDRSLLYACIEPALDSREFFLRKAIGWALRELAWTDPDEVIRYVREHAAQLSPLSKREALKNLLKSGRIDAIP
ncbi:MAG: DNA alkylation repair protein [Candidatus Wallbacteria bacterium]|nr:DNA alkylation repair protein [Candidatus Wallbacteria bacterium]